MGKNKGTSFSFYTNATSEVMIRTKGDTENSYNSEKIFNVSDSMELRLGISCEDEQESPYSLGLSGYHMKDEDSGEYYHNRIEMFLTKNDLINLAKYAQFLVDVNAEDDE